MYVVFGLLLFGWMVNLIGDLLDFIICDWSNGGKEFVILISVVTGVSCLIVYWQVRMVK